ncbi:hypothetical protein SAMN02799622_04347 [Methylobacterium sp. UNC378MF]|uniref:site-specific integrase n=1 Tax=Methylobacterium sp. UNC378MF TaxID=1502748 RepID=UPI00088941AB|nr:site-specific integrase [Methylobacterium sp. UNC378MF]SDA28626.1 hypothetical protein SAMN02799622_04347 [Methylobacterium sp. UNC378MF]
MADSLHLVNRAGVWYYRRRVPETARAAVGKTFVQFSLKTTSKAEAKKLREAWDLRWSAEFDKASSTVGDYPGVGLNRRALTEAGALRLVRDYVERLDKRFQDRQLADGPESEAQRAQIVADIEYGAQMLRDLDDPRGAERVFAAEKKLTSETGAEPGPGGITEVAFAELVRRGLLEVDYRKLARLADDYSRRSLDPLFDPAAPPPVTFAELADQFLEAVTDEAEANGTSQKSLDRQRAYVALMRQLIGEDTLVKDLDYDACQEVRRLLARVPTNFTKIYRGAPLREAIERADADGRERLASITQGQYLAALREVLDLALKKRLIPVNPAEGLKPLRRDDLSPAERRQPFTPEQLAVFFQSDFYREAAASGPAPYRYDTKRGWRFWLPLLCLFTGLRPREVLQMHVDDVQRTKEGTFYLDVVASDDEDDAPLRKTLKTKSSRRRVPLHPALIRIGFLSFVADRAGLDRGPQIFPLTTNKYGDPASYPLKRFNEKFLREEMPNLGQRQPFYSFRHSFRDGLRAIGASPDVLQALGWSQGSRVVSDHYGAGLDPDQLFEYVKKLSFKGVDLSHLYDRR